MIKVISLGNSKTNVNLGPKHNSVSENHYNRTKVKNATMYDCNISIK